MNVFVGVDVSKDRLDVCILQENSSPESRSFPNDAEGCDAIVAALQGRQVERIVCESSGGYERLLVARASLAGLPIVQVNARQVRDFVDGLRSQRDFEVALDHLSVEGRCAGCRVETA